MKKYFFAILLVILTAACAACGKNDNVIATNTPEPETTISVAPDFSGTDFTGIWHVSGVLYPDGTPASSSEMQDMGADFTIEFLANKTYLLYDEKGKVFGQGGYSVLKNVLTCSGGGKETKYEIKDKDTLSCVSEDKSVTILSRKIEEQEPLEPSEKNKPDESGGGEQDEPTDNGEDDIG